MNPYTEERNSSISIRKFLSSVAEEELKWHWDEEDREIESIGKTDWKFQFDNELPMKIDKKIRIERGRIHRIIKGSGDLALKITFL